LKTKVTKQTLNRLNKRVIKSSMEHSKEGLLLLGFLELEWW
jgi:hypothetical protein